MVKNSKKYTLALLVASLGLSMAPAQATTVTTQATTATTTESKLKGEIESLKTQIREANWGSIMGRAVVATALTPATIGMSYVYATVREEYGLWAHGLLLPTVLANGYLCGESYYQTIRGLYRKYNNRKINKEIAKKEAELTAELANKVTSQQPS
jgi:hypothetical protein